MYIARVMYIYEKRGKFYFDALLQYSFNTSHYEKGSQSSVQSHCVQRCGTLHPVDYERSKLSDHLHDLYDGLQQAWQ